ncbi:MAG: AmpG family muropeptide MFS transporter [Rhodospirillales bacterium]
MDSAAPARSWRDSLSVYLERRVMVVLALGFSGGLPLALTGATLSWRLREADTSLAAIGVFGLVGSAYALKFLWAPVVDRAPLPVLTRAFGRRRGWLLASQAAVAAAMVGTGLAGPEISLHAVALWAVALAFASATQDIVIDAFRIESLDENQQGAGAAVYVLGYRIAMAVSGGGALMLGGALGWDAAYAAMAVLMALGMGAALFAREPSPPLENINKGMTYADWFMAAAAGPFRDFMTRQSWAVILVFIVFYKYGDALLGLMATPFYRDIGFDVMEVGVIVKWFGLGATLLGGVLGGVMIARWGVMAGLLIGGVAQAASNLVFMALAAVGPNVPFLALTVAVENVTGGMGTIAFVAYLSALCSVEYTATQFALLSSLTAFARTLFSAGGGWLAERTDWVVYFGLTTLAAVPGLLLLLYLMRHAPSPGARAETGAAARDAPGGV